jgi:hypothetical protein
MYAFVHIEKTAGTTLNTIFRRSFGTGHCDIRLPLVKRKHDVHDQRVFIDAADLRRVRQLYRNLRGIAGHNVKPYANLQAECSEVQFFTFLRDPVAQFRSYFLHRGLDRGVDRRLGHSYAAFDQWISSSWVHNWQTKMIAGVANAQKAIDLISDRIGFVGLTERFDESLLLLRQWLRDPAFQVEYQSVNRLIDRRGPRDAARIKAEISYLDSAAVRERIQEVNAEDQKVYDYVAANVYPRQVAAYQGDLPAELQCLQERNQRAARFNEPFAGRFLRNYIYKPLLHCYLI